MIKVSKFRKTKIYLPWYWWNRRLKASTPCMQANLHELDFNEHVVSLAAAAIQSKKPLVGPKALIGLPCHGRR